MFSGPKRLSTWGVSDDERTTRRYRIGAQRLVVACESNLLAVLEVAEEKLPKGKHRMIYLGVFVLGLVCGAVCVLIFAALGVADVQMQITAAEQERVIR